MGDKTEFSPRDPSKLTSLEDCLAEYIPQDKLQSVYRILYGTPLKEIPIDQSIKDQATNLDIDLKTCVFDAKPEELRPRRITRVGLIQNGIVLPTTENLQSQRAGIYERVSGIIKIAGQTGVNVVCLQEAWTMPFAFCTREKFPWCELAESAEDGPTTKLLSLLAAKYNMVIVSPILERDERDSDTIWNTAVVISNSGRVLGKSRKNHIPRVGDFNESTYYFESQLGHPVFETQFGRIAINICYGRHHPLNWLMYALNGAEIVFNPSATVTGLSEPLWGVEARNAAISNNYYTCAINRVGTETFPRAFSSGNHTEPHTDFGHFYGSSHMNGPDGSRSVGLSRYQDGLLISDIDLNACRQQRDWWGFPMTRRLGMYAERLTAASKPDYVQQIVREN